MELLYTSMSSDIESSSSFKLFQNMTDNDEKEATVTVKLSMLNVALIIASVLYLFCFIIAKRKLASLHRINPDLGLKKLLALSILLVCVIRIMTFIGVTALDIANVRAHYSPKPPSTSTSISQNQSFYDESMTVLFDLPNTIVVSTYILLTLCWGECFLQSRLHTENTTKWKKRWLMGYTIFNSCLYATQIILYILVFWPFGMGKGSNDNGGGMKIVMRTVLYAAMTGINFSAVILVGVLYSYLNLKFAGFPFRSRQTRSSFEQISSVFALWSFSRIIWAIAMLITFIGGVDLLDNSQSPFWTPIGLFCLLFCCEIIPIVCMLDHSYMQMIHFERFSTTLEPYHCNTVENEAGEKVEEEEGNGHIAEESDTEDSHNQNGSLCSNSVLQEESNASPLYEKNGEEEEYDSENVTSTTSSVASGSMRMMQRPLLLPDDQEIEYYE